jgi:hypothetical protein
MRKELSNLQGGSINSHALGRVREILSTERVGNGD